MVVPLVDSAVDEDSCGRAEQHAEADGEED
jgi:hypothetical protein